MPLYCYICRSCGERHEEYRKIGDHIEHCRCGGILDRDYMAEVPAVIGDWEPGFNPSINYYYKSKDDLLNEIRRRKLYPGVNGGSSVKKAKSGWYGDEEHRSIHEFSKKEHDESEVTIE